MHGSRESQEDREREPTSKLLRVKYIRKGKTLQSTLIESKKGGSLQESQKIAAFPTSKRQHDLISKGRINYLSIYIKESIYEKDDVNTASKCCRNSATMRAACQ